jgi:hypothetical protein
MGEQLCEPERQTRRDLQSTSTAQPGYASRYAATFLVGVLPKTKPIYMVNLRSLSHCRLFYA